MTAESDIAELQTWVERHGEGASLTLSFVQAKALLDELKRLQQSDGMLRRQNKKLRRREARDLGAGCTPDLPPT
jgi:hypothetical protein